MVVVEIGRFLPGVVGLVEILGFVVGWTCLGEIRVVEL